MAKSYTFSGQREGESVLGVVKTHPVVLLGPGLRVILLLLIALAILLYLPANQYLALISGVIFLASISTFAGAVYYFRESNIILTSQRVISVEQRGFWQNKITEVSLANIQDMSSQVSGFLGSLFKCGSLVIRSAGGSNGGEIVLRNIYRPYDLQKEIAGKIGTV